jgi:quinol monooxygenase YgiN
MGTFVIACYRPKPGKEAELEALAREHVPILRNEGLVTDRAPYAMRAKDGSVVKVFEWVSDKAIETAHANPEVLKLWARYEAVWEYVSLNTLAETSDMFASFEPL